MAHPEFLAGELAARTGLSRKALRLYETAGILLPPARTPAGYRVYGPETLRLLQFVARARRLGFGLAEIKAIVALKRSGHAPCEQVRAPARERVAALDRTLRELAEQRQLLRDLLAAWRRRPGHEAVVCPHIEHGSRAEQRRKGKW